jgi:hypothetical protein
VSHRPSAARVAASQSRQARFLIAAVVLAAAAWLGAAHAQSFELASAEQARRVLGDRDDFVKRMSQFDRAARMKTDRAVSENEYLAFAAAAARDWDDAEKQAVNAALQSIEGPLRTLTLPLRGRVQIVKTTGEEEGSAAYTRGRAVILPARLIAKTEGLPKLLAHELFHIASSDEQFADTLYATIGFLPCKERPYPPELTARKLTNPDAPRHDHCIAVTLEGMPASVTPILYSRTATYDTTRGGEFFEYLQLGLLVVEPPRDPPRVVGMRDVTGFFEQVGENTQYVIHPEEILADNFSQLVVGETNVKSPEVHQKMRLALTAFGSSVKAPR